MAAPSHRLGHKLSKKEKDAQALISLLPACRCYVTSCFKLDTTPPPGLMTSNHDKNKPFLPFLKRFSPRNEKTIRTLEWQQCHCSDQSYYVIHSLWNSATGRTWKNLELWDKKDHEGDMNRWAGPSPWSWKTGVLTKMCAHRTGSWNFKQQGLYWDLSSSIHVVMTSRIWLHSSCFLKTHVRLLQRKWTNHRYGGGKYQGRRELRLWAAFFPHPRPWWERAKSGTNHG